MSIVIPKQKSEMIIVENNLIKENSFCLSYPDFIEILGIQTIENLTRSALIESGIIGFDGSKFQINSNLDSQQLMGHFFESFLVNLIKGYPFIKESFFKWCCWYTESDFEKDNYGYKYFQELLYYTYPVAKGQRSTKIMYPNLYCPACKDDIALYVKNLNNHGKQVNLGKFQVKAINSQEKAQIILPMLDGTYDCVITLLELDGVHSFKRCEIVLDKMIKNEEIDYEDAQNVLSRLVIPEDMSIPQSFVNDTYGKVINALQRGFKPGGNKQAMLIPALTSVATKFLGDKPRII